MIEHSKFVSDIGLREDFFAATSTGGDAFIIEAETLLSSYFSELSRHDCSQASDWVLRVQLSAITNPVLKLSPLLW